MKMSTQEQRERIAKMIFSEFASDEEINAIYNTLNVNIKLGRVVKYRDPKKQDMFNIEEDDQHEDEWLREETEYYHKKAEWELEKQ